MLISAEKLRSLVPTEETDEILEMKLTALENLIRKHTHNDFQIREIRSYSEVFQNKVINPPLNIAVGDTVQISQSLLNNGIYTVTEITDEGITVSGTLLDCTKNLITKVSYPPDVVLGAVNLYKWDLQNRPKVGIQSETIARHSVTYFNMDDDNAVMGYPKSLLGFLKPYMKART
jgi:hypothetical protein